ncbi:Ger(x)C family spore germination protein [Cohnella sp. GCM10027633]|uniref:Ger(x)C family spore germination protein n=1 Tax=unclassified Cohnella TaxID=2636738 RepID=UPI00363540ED
MKPILCFCMLGCAILLSGCWDRTEINDLAFITGSAFDRTKEGKYVLSVQLAIPHGELGTGGGSREKFFVLSGTGKNASEAFEIIQKKSSRRLFTAHRSVIFIGESLGRHGIGDVLDVFAHDPRQRLKTYMMVVKGEAGQKLLETKYPFEQVPVEAIKELEGLHTEMAVTLRDYFIADSSPGVSPVLGAIETTEDGMGDGKSKDGELFKLAGTAVFNGTRIVGFLNGSETSGFLWATDRMKNGRVTADLPGGQGNVGILLRRANRRIVASGEGDQLQVNIRLEGVGSLVENNSRLDISRPDNLAIVRQALERSVAEQVRNVMNKLQKQFKTDSIGIGQSIYRNQPKRWKKLRDDWDAIYAHANVAVEVKLSIVGAGMAGPPLQLNEKEIVE